MSDLPPECLDLERRLNAALSILEGRVVDGRLMDEVRLTMLKIEVKWAAEFPCDS